MSNLVKTVIALLILIGVAILGTRLVNEWLLAPQVKFTKCVDNGKVYEATVSTEPSDPFNKCLANQAQKFLDRDYADFKDIGKAFLTLLSATLVASITFSEKIVDVGKADLLPMTTMIACWLLLIFSIITLVFGFANMAHAAWTVQYDPYINFLSLENNGVKLLFYSVAAFVGSLVALVIAGVISLFQRRAAPAVAVKQSP